MTREKLTLRLHEELALTELTVETESWQERQRTGRPGSTRSSNVASDGQQGHPVGKGGETIKSVSKASARGDWRSSSAARCTCSLQVKVRLNWLEEAERYFEMGLGFPRRGA